jgi:GTPase SAR1 family protein
VVSESLAAAWVEDMPPSETGLASRVLTGSAAYARAVRVLLTGMSGAGKSTLVSELRQRGYEAYDADDHGFSEPREDGRWGWRIEMVSNLLTSHSDRLIFFAGCSEEQAAFPFDIRVLLSAPTSVLIDRLRTRTNNSYGREVRERTQILADLTASENRRSCFNAATAFRVAQVWRHVWTAPGLDDTSWLL